MKVWWGAIGILAALGTPAAWSFEADARQADGAGSVAHRPSGSTGLQKAKRSVVFVG
jgi:hypothetical protein